MSSTAGGGSGWLTTKKRGRDDDQIIRDRKRALEARRSQQPTRRQQQQQQQQKPKAKPKSQKPNKPAAKKLFNDNLDNFVVEDDDDDDVEILNESSSDDDEVDFESSSDDEVSNKRKGRSSKVLKRNPPDVNDDTDDDDSSEGGTFFQSYPTRTSRPAPALRKISQSNTSNRLGGRKLQFQTLAFKTDARQAFRKQGAAESKKKSVTKLRASSAPMRKNETHDILLMSSDEESGSPTPPASSTTSRFFPPMPKPSATAARVSTSSNSLDSDTYEPQSNNKALNFEPKRSRNDKNYSSGSDNDDNIRRNGQQKGSIPAKLPSKKLVIEDSDEDDNDDNNHKPASKPKLMKRSKPNIHDSDDDADFAELSSSSMPNKVAHKKKLVLREDDETSPMVMKSSFQPKSSFLDDSSMDDDEAVALAWAIEASQKETTHAEGHRSPAFVGASKAIAETPEVIQVDEACGDSPSEDAMVASVVLATANSLSSQVLQTMLRWSLNRSGGGEGNEETSKVPQGLLVDGALALHSSFGVSPDPSWISQDLMQKVCPHVQLKDYQLIGVNWLALLHRMKCELKGKTYTHVNGILADEMGLGKTVQTIAFLAWLKYAEGKEKSVASNSKNAAVDLSSSDDDDLLDDDPRVVSLENSDDDDDDDEVPAARGNFHPHIIVAPSSVVSNWKREFERFCPEMKVVMYNGSMENRKVVRNELRQYMRGQYRHGDVVPDVILTINSYFSSEGADDRNFFRKIKFDYLVVDEGHILKNPTSKRYKNMDMLRTNHRVLLTGTPVQNAPKELMALLCFLMPLFSGRSSSDDYVSNDGGKSMLQHFVQLEKEGESDKTAYEKLKQLFAPFVLRRTKNDVLSQILPEKERRVEILAMDAASLALYNNILASQCKKARKVASTNDHSTLWSVFTDLRKSVNHPLLLRTRHNTPDDIHHLAKSFMMYGFFSGNGCTLDKVKKELEGYNDLDIHLAALELIEENPRREKELSRYVLEEDDLFSSAKFVRLRQLLPELISEGHRVLIFSQWTRVLDLLGILLENLGLRFLRLDGSVSTESRQGLIDNFNDDNSIHAFLLSTRAGGLGINLTTADTCIMHDLDFNPFNDLQAEDRCHRIGQKKKVTVIKMVAKDTVDEYIYNMQQRKAQMNAAIMENPDSAEWFKKAQLSDMECILQTALDQFRSSNFGKKLAVSAAPPSVTSTLGAVSSDKAAVNPGQGSTGSDAANEIPSTEGLDAVAATGNAGLQEAMANPAGETNGELKNEQGAEEPAATQGEISV